MAIQKRQTSTKIDFMKAANNIGKPVAAVAGFAIGKFTLKKLNNSSTVSGLLGTDLKSYILPAAVTMSGLLCTQLTKNQYIQLGLVGAAGAGVEAMIKKATGKTLLQGLEGIIGAEDYTDCEDVDGLQALNPVTQALPAADIDIEREIQASVAGAASDYGMSDEPVGNAAEDYSMSDEPVGKLNETDPDSMDFDIFSGDMTES